jgi:NAD(P)-dependent dehydrogenase (short-subunit alcohol dehydrogenase family)
MAKGSMRWRRELGCPVVPAVGDVADTALWEGFEADVAARFGSIDCALANAGVGHKMTPIAELEPETWSRVIGVNLTGAFLTLRTSLRRMNEGGAIVLVSSSMGVKPSPNTAGYGASKAALLQLARIAALEAAPRKIRVNAISPGGVETPCSATRPSSPPWWARPAASAVLSMRWRRVRLWDAMPAPTRPPA